MRAARSGDDHARSDRAAAPRRPAAAATQPRAEDTGTGRRPVVVAETVQRIGPALADRLSGHWHIRLGDQPFRAGQELSELSERAKELAGDHGWDAVGGLTDLPIVVDGRIALADLSPAERVAVLSVPALGH